MTGIPVLFTRLFDDAAIYPPGNAPLPDAVADHRGHGDSWYHDLVGPFVCDTSRLSAVEQAVEREGCGPLNVSVVVPKGAAALAEVIDRVESADHLQLAALEIPVRNGEVAEAVCLAHAVRSPVPIHLEMPARSVELDVLEGLVARDIALKLRTGGMDAAAFPSAEELARAIMLCARAGAAFKCTAGLHNAVRHRDYATGFEHHGFLNVLAAVALALDGADVGDLEEVLEATDSCQLGATVATASDADAATIRRIFRSFGTCSIRDPVHDLVALGFVRVPERVP